MTLTNIRTAETREPQFNPEKVTEEIEANWTSLQPLGYSHEPQQFKNTGNLKLGFELTFNGDTNYGGGGGGAFIHDTRQFLISMMYSSASAQDVISGAPARALFVWPEMWAIQCVIKKSTFVHDWFSRTGHSMRYTAQLELILVSDFRIISENIRERGYRGGGG